MERIQSALEKARKSRGEGGGKQTQTQRSTLPPSPTPRQDAAASSAWEALPEFRPSQRHLSRQRVLTTERGAQAAPFDVLRTKILQRMKDNSWTTLAVTSPESGCGKTTTTLNLAFSLARQSDIRIAVIDLDLRRPALARTMGLEKGRIQISAALSGKSPLSENLVRVGSNLIIGTNDEPVRRAPSELLQSNSLHRCFEDLHATYAPTIVLFDMPPILSGDDMRGFADSVDAALLVAAAGSTSIDQVDQCEKELSERTNVMGVVLNKCRYMGKNYAYDYYG